MATVKMTVLQRTPGGNRSDTPMALVAGREQSTATMTSAATNKRFETAGDIAESTGVVANAGDTVVIYTTGDIKLAVTVGAQGDATSAYQHIVFASSWSVFYVDRNDTRFAVADL